MRITITAGQLNTYDSNKAFYINNIDIGGEKFDLVVLKNKYPWMKPIIDNANEGDQIVCEGWVAKDKSRGKKLILTYLSNIDNATPDYNSCIVEYCIIHNYNKEYSIMACEEGVCPECGNALKVAIGINGKFLCDNSCWF